MSRPFRSGFCNATNPPEIHARCAGNYQGHVCTCDHHTKASAMTLRILDDLEQGSDAWIEARRGLITASVIGQLLTSTGKVADNDTSRGLIAKLAAERITGEVEPSYMNDDMLRGVIHEPIAREKYAAHNRVPVEQVGLMIRTGPDFEVAASPDGLIGNHGGLEIKCPRAKTHIKTIVADEVPSHYMAQVQASLFVSGRKWWDFVSFNAGLPLWSKRVYPDDDWQQAVLDATVAAEAAIQRMTFEYAERSALLPATEPIDNFDEIKVA